MKVNSKFPYSEASIFSIMSNLASQNNAINLGQGFPNFDCDPVLKDMVNHFLCKGKNQYAPMIGVLELRQAIAAKFDDSYGVKLNIEKEITITAGATQALYCAITAFVGRGDEVIIIDPAYDSYRPVIELNNAVAIAYELKAPDYRVNWKEFAKLISPRTKMVIINNPHNPLGTIYSSEDLDQLSELLRDTDTVVLSDEVYEHLVYDQQTHITVMEHEVLKNRSLATYSFGKTFHITGWKVGYCVGSENLMREFRQVHQWNVFSVNSICQYALADYMQDKSHYEDLADFYVHKRDLFQNEMEGSKFSPIKCEGSYFQLYDYSAISDKPDTEFAEILVREYGVACIPVSVFYESRRQDRVVRFCFAKTDETLLEAAKKLRAVKSI